MNARSLLPRRWPHNPIQLAERVVYRYTVGRRRYGRGQDYAARDYWGDRLARFGGSLKGPGRESMTERANEEAYAEKARILAAMLDDEGISLAGKRVLEVGCGNGYWAGFVDAQAPGADYVGLDITDVQFAALRERFPSARFVQADVTESLSDLGPFDVVLMLDVVEHIVTEERLEQAMANVRSLLAPGGAWVVSGLAPHESRPFFYLRWWSVERFRRGCAGCRVGEPRTFADPRNLVVTIHAPAEEPGPGRPTAGTNRADAR